MIFKVSRERQSESSRQKVLSCADRCRTANENARLLDVGCGDGKTSLEFAGRLGVKQVCGVDVYGPSLEKARARGITVAKGDLNSKVLPFPDDFFNFVLCHQVAEHLRNPDNLFQEIHRVLKPGGQLVISVPNLCSLHNRFFVLIGRHPTVISPSSRYNFGNLTRNERLDTLEIHRHNTAFSPAAFKEMLTHYGFHLDAYIGSGLHPFNNGFTDFMLSAFPGWGVIQIAVASKKDHKGETHAT